MLTSLKTKVKYSLALRAGEAVLWGTSWQVLTLSVAMKLTIE